jgi:hypothetical protein
VSANNLSWASVRKLNQLAGDGFVHAVVWSHHDSGRWAVAVRHDGSATAVNRSTGETAPTTEMTATMALLRTRRPRWPTDEDWLAELDRRQAELEGGR